MTGAARAASDTGLGAINLGNANEAENGMLSRCELANAQPHSPHSRSI